MMCSLWYSLVCLYRRHVALDVILSSNPWEPAIIRESKINVDCPQGGMWVQISLAHPALVGPSPVSNV